MVQLSVRTAVIAAAHENRSLSSCMVSSCLAMCRCWIPRRASAGGAAPHAASPRGRRPHHAAPLKPFRGPRGRRTLSKCDTPEPPTTVSDVSSGIVKRIASGVGEGRRCGSALLFFGRRDVGAAPPQPIGIEAAGKCCSTSDRMRCGDGPERPEGTGYPKRICITRCQILALWGGCFSKLFSERGWYALQRATRIASVAPQSAVFAREPELASDRARDSSASTSSADTPGSIPAAVSKTTFATLSPLMIKKRAMA